MSTNNVIADLRQGGKQWSEIAEHVGLSEEATRSRFRRWSKRQKRLDAGGTAHEVTVPHVDWRNSIASANSIQRVYDDAEYWDRDEVNIDIDSDDPFILAITSDWHLGERTCDMGMLAHDIESWIQTPNLHTIIVGDMTENGTGTQGLQSVTDQVLSPELQLLTVRDIFRELDDNNKLLAVSGGNHEDRSGRVLYETFRFLVEDTEVPSFGNKGVINLHAGDETFTLFVGHKLPGKTINNPFGAHMRVFKEVIVPDISAIGHVHTWNYGLTSAYGKAVHMCTMGSYVRQEYAVRFYNKGLPNVNHYFTIWPRHKMIEHYKTLDEATLARDS